MADILFSDEDDCEDAVDEVMKDYNLDLYEVSIQRSIHQRDGVWAGGQHAGVGGGVCLWFYAEPRPDQSARILQQSSPGGLHCPTVTNPRLQNKNS